MNGKLKLINSPFKRKSNKTMKTIRLIITLLAVLFFANKTSAQNEEVLYYPKLPSLGNEGIRGAKDELAKILLKTETWDNKKKYSRSFPKNVSVFEDRFEMTFKKYSTTFYFNDLPNYTIQIIQIKNVREVVVKKESSVPVPINENLIRLGEVMFSEYTFQSTDSYKEYGTLEKLADYLFFFQHQLNIQRYDSLITLFEPIAAKYRELKAKPQISETQREYIVQANSFNQEKNYHKAIELYNKAIEVDQTAYAAGYSNLALLSAQISKFDAAIYYMKKYLLLEPEASDARSAQDKIYEWKAKINK